MFAEGFRNEVQVINTVLLTMKMHLHQWQLCLVHHWLSLLSPDIPFDGPIAGVAGSVMLTKSFQPKARTNRAIASELTVLVLSTLINMVESGAKELSEEIMLEALLKGHEAVKELIAFKKKSLQRLVKKKQKELLHVDADLQAEIIAACATVTFKKLFKLKKIGAEAANSKQSKTKSQQFTKKNMQTTKNLTVSCVMWTGNLGTNGTRRSAPFDHRRQGSS